MGLEDYRIAHPGTKVEIADGSFLEVKGHGRLQLVLAKRLME